MLFSTFERKLVIPDFILRIIVMKSEFLTKYNFHIEAVKLQKSSYAQTEELLVILNLLQE